MQVELGFDDAFKGALFRGRTGHLMSNDCAVRSFEILARLPIRDTDGRTIAADWPGGLYAIRTNRDRIR